jgi:crotonobetainyl-CoA:carnitine CoA-transferase CaiB-like acyl-CoA transferase
VSVTVGEAGRADLPALPLRMRGRRAGVRLDVPRAGEHSRAVLADALGLGLDEIETLERSGAIA